MRLRALAFLVLCILCGVCAVFMYGEGLQLRWVVSRTVGDKMPDNVELLRTQISVLQARLNMSELRGAQSAELAAMIAARAREAENKFIVQENRKNAEIRIYATATKEAEAALVAQEKRENAEIGKLKEVQARKPEAESYGKRLHEEPRWYIGIVSKMKNIAARDRIRQSWMADIRKRYTAQQVHVEFVLGHVNLPPVQGGVPEAEDLKLEKRVLEEQRRHMDILRIPLIDTYSSLVDKVVNVFDEGLRAGADYILKVDDDFELHVDAVQTVLSRFRADDLIYVAWVLWRKAWSPTQRGADGQFAPYASGPCYVLSRSLAKRIFQLHRTRTMEFALYGSKSEDMDMGRWVNYERELGSNVTLSEEGSLGKLLEVQTEH